MKLLTTLTLTIISFVALGQDRIQSIKNWKQLAEVEFIKSNDGYAEIYLPSFSAGIKALEGKEVTLQGYIVPNDGLFKSDEFIISSLPLAQCFFCGGDSGPESVAYVFPQEPIKYTAKTVTVKGKLELNETDSNKLLYTLNNATVEIVNN